ncbi:MAG: hypothetical protein ACM3Q2_10825 [Syntrophothermus sp.]
MPAKKQIHLPAIPAEYNNYHKENEEKEFNKSIGKDNRVTTAMFRWA